MTSSATAILSMLLKESAPHRHPRFHEFLAMGANATQALLIEASKPRPRSYGFTLAFLASCVGEPGYGLLCDALQNENDRLVSFSSTTLGLMGLKTAPIILAIGPTTSHEANIRYLWALGAFLNAVNHHPDLGSVLMQKVKEMGIDDLLPLVSLDPSGTKMARKLHERRKKLSATTAKAERTYQAFSDGALWIWLNRANFAIGTKTKHGAITEGGLPARIEHKKTDEVARVSMVMSWLLNVDTLGEPLHSSLENCWQKSEEPELLRSYWALGCTWALRQLSYEAVRNSPKL